ncbi:MAG TPA: hypothetical protein VFI70_00635 [Nitrososphaeraceae archaeon]|nr:hypothetical protein [Nitrososphaeraceae archaeon]
MWTPPSLSSVAKFAMRVLTITAPVEEKVMGNIRLGTQLKLLVRIFRSKRLNNYIFQTYQYCLVDYYEVLELNKNNGNRLLSNNQDKFCRTIILTKDMSACIYRLIKREKKISDKIPLADESLRDYDNGENRRRLYRTKNKMIYLLVFSHVCRHYVFIRINTLCN